MLPLFLNSSLAYTPINQGYIGHKKRFCSKFIWLCPSQISLVNGKKKGGEKSKAMGLEVIVFPVKGTYFNLFPTCIN